MPEETSSNSGDGSEKSMNQRQQRARQWYYTAKRLQENGRDEEALEFYKRIYEIDYSDKDVAVIVENSYSE